MKNLNESFLEKIKSNKLKVLDFIPLFNEYLDNNEVTWDSLLFIKKYLYQVKKGDLLDDFLLEYIKHKSYDFNNVNKMLLYLNHPLSRRIIINLIKLKIINDDNINSIGMDRVKIYYDIINNNYTFNYSMNSAEKLYRDVKCYDNNWFQYHCNQIEKIPVLSDEEELYLFFERDKGKKEAIDYLILSNLRLVRALAKNYAYKIGSNEIDELYQNGILGLINAIYNYDVYTGIKFSTYATHSIARFIRRENLKDRLIYIPTDIAEGTRTAIDEETQIFVSNATQGFISLEQEMNDSDADETVGDYVTADYDQYANNEFLKPVEDVVEFNQMIEQTNSLINSLLTEEELNIIKSYIYDELTQKEIVVLYSLNMTHQNLSLRIKKIIKKLKENQEFRSLLDYIVCDKKEKECSEMSTKKEKEITTKVENDSYDYRQITINRLKRDFQPYGFITEDDILNEVNRIDEIIKIKRIIVQNNGLLSEELLKDNTNVMSIMNRVKSLAQQLKQLTNDKSYNKLFRNEIDLLVNIYDTFNDSKKAKRVDKMEIVYAISAVNGNYDPNPLMNYMTADTTLYLKVAKQVRKEKKDNVTTTLDIAKNDINSHFYSLVKTAHIGFFKDNDESNIKTLLGDILESYQGDCLMLEHIKNVTKEQYEFLNGDYIPPTSEIDDDEEDDYDYEIKPGHYSEIEYYGHYMKIWKQVNTSDLNYYDFLVLKFKRLVSFDDLVSVFPNAHQYYADAINYINDDITKNKKDNVKTLLK